jgi:methionyl aminopeptidase
MLRLPLRLSNSSRLICRPTFPNRAPLFLQRHPTRRLFSSNELGLGSPLEETEDFGTYSVILPPEPFVFGVSHIKPRQVPPEIVRPAYVNNNGNEVLEGICKPESRVRLGGEDELRLRSAASLARRVREYAGSLVRVNSFSFELLRS